MTVVVQIVPHTEDDISRNPETYPQYRPQVAHGPTEYHTMGFC